MRKSAKPAPAQLTEAEFTLLAIRKLRDKKHPQWTGINTIFSGFNAAFKEYFGKDADPIAATKKLAEDGVIVMVPARRGVTIYTAEDAKAGGIKPPSPPSETLARILG
jgi:hypothetical protein